MSPAKARRALLVLGMHRSGTSALARVLSLRGANLPATLLAPNRGNPSGYWESSPLVAFNDALLESFGTAWDDPFAPFHLPEPSMYPRRLLVEAGALLAREFGDARLLVLKDPRNCLLAGFWMQVLAEAGIEACPVLLARPCAEVAASLLQRDHAIPEASALVYVASCVEAALSVAQPTVLTHAQLIADWRAATDRIAAEQGLQWPRDDAALDAEVTAFLEPGRAKVAPLHAAPQVQAWIDTVWAWYTAAAAGQSPDLAPLRDIRESLAQAARSYGPLVAGLRMRAQGLDADAGAPPPRHEHEREREALLQHTAAERDELMRERDLLLALHKQHEVHAQAWTGVAEERARLAATVARQEKEGAERQRAFAELRAERDTLLGRFQEARTASLKLEHDAEALVAERDSALAAWQATDAKLHDTERSFATVAAEREQLQASSMALAAAHERLQATATALVQERDRLQATTDGLMVEREQLHATRDGLQLRMSELEAERGTMLARTAELEEARQSLAASLAEFEAALSAASAELEHRAQEARVAAAERDVILRDLDAERALGAQRAVDAAQLRDMLEEAGTARTSAERDLQRLQRELDNTRSELRRAQDGLSQVQASRSWRITAPLRSVANAGRSILRVTHNSLHRPKRLLQLAPPEPAKPPAAVATPTQPTFARRKHPGLKAYLEPEFGLEAAREVMLRIDRFRLPIDIGAGRAASAVTCTDEEAEAWLAAIAERAAARMGDDEAPDVSIVVPVFNQLPFTLACLDALLAHASRFRFEILVGDDASTDGTAHAFARPIAGVHYLRHAGNLGFVRNCNETAKLARGRYVVMLNNDALVLPGWLDEMISVLESNPSVGLVGSKLVYPDGRLQECGGIVWRDGSAWNHGRLDDPRRPEHNYLRGVDFVSGASIALPTPLWRRLGGFDELFVPAYAEDVDLAFRIRAQGLYTLVQPLSQVLHFEGVSAGTDLGQGMKAHQVANLRKLHQRWEAKLAVHRDNGQQPELEKERDSSRRLLFIDHCTLTPNEDAGSLVAFEILTSFRRHGYKVTFIPEDNFAHMGEDTRVLQRLGVETIYHPAYSRMEQFLAARNDEFDVVVMHRFSVGDRHLAALRAKYPRARFVFLACDLHYLREQREAELSGDPAARQRAERTRQRELAVVEASDAVVVYSDAEQAIVQAALPRARVSLFPLVHDPVAHPAPLSAREGVCFVGGYRHAPNADAIRWFVDQVWPLVHARVPHAVLHVAGSHMTEEVKALGHRPGVEITGFVPDMESFLAARRVNVAPLRFGAGVKGKVANSLANGLPTVGTHIAAEGMQLTPGQDILVADDPEPFAEHVVQLLVDDALWQRVSDAGLEYASTVTSRASAHARIGDLLGLLGLPVQA